MHRRTLLAILAVSYPSAVLRRRAAAQSARSLDPEVLRALAQAVLPTALDREAVQAAADGFGRWLTDYRGGAELLHGYGSATIRRTPASPVPRWAGQLQALDQEARRRHGRSFAAAGRGDRVALVEAALAPDGSALPPVAEARHVAVGLLAWWAGTPAAHDLAYRARIRPFNCRPLAANPEQPRPLESSS